MSPFVCVCICICICISIASSAIARCIGNHFHMSHCLGAMEYVISACFHCLQSDRPVYRQSFLWVSLSRGNGICHFRLFPLPQKRLLGVQAIIFMHLTVSGQWNLSFPPVSIASSAIARCIGNHFHMSHCLGAMDRKWRRSILVSHISAAVSHIIEEILLSKTSEFPKALARECGHRLFVFLRESV